MTAEEPIPCTTPGCNNVKYFPGRCNPCQREEEKGTTPLRDPYAGMSWVEESMTKTGVDPNRRK